MDQFTIKKAKLLEAGRISIAKGVNVPYPFEHSKIGPSSGERSLFLKFNDRRVKLKISKQKTKFTLHQDGDAYYIAEHDKPFLKDVEIIPVYAHAPDQAFISLENRCIHRCAFCNYTSSPRESNERLISFVRKLVERGVCRSVAITSGIYPSNERVIRRMVDFIRSIKNFYPDLPIGVEPLIEKREEIEKLRDADEIKVNVQFSRREIFDALCPTLNYDKMYRMVEEAVDVFGKEKVTSNIIYGVGEGDEDIAGTIKKLSSIGVVPTLRKISVTERNRDRIEKALGYRLREASYERMIKLALLHKKFLERYNLSTRKFKTMCHACGGCDLVPFWDL